MNGVPAQDAQFHDNFARLLGGTRTASLEEHLHTALGIVDQHRVASVRLNVAQIDCEGIGRVLDLDSSVMNIDSVHVISI